MAIPAPGAETTTDEFARYVIEGVFANPEVKDTYYLTSQKQSDISYFAYALAAKLVTAGGWTVLANKTLKDEYAQSVLVGQLANPERKNVYYLTDQQQTDIANFCYTMALALTTAGGY